MPTPPNWPRDIRYLEQCVYHSSLTSEIRKQLLESPSSQASETHSKVLIRKIVSTDHPANGQYGLFAGKKIPPNAFILDYIGELHCDDRPESDYDLSLLRLPDGTSIGVDASRMGNEARFVNDYRGVKQKPNAIFADSRSRSGELRICIRSRDEIKKGEEILVSYGKSWWTSRQQASEADINEA
ncbi:SET domain protein [Coprinopsis sp. MPI-PUGE-AT-0042]|nr:SET domain protein [Coprinopsis sp. MPI-PUGE-AT-0042]